MVGDGNGDRNTGRDRSSNGGRRKEQRCGSEMNLIFCDVVEEYIPKAGVTFPTVEEAAAFYKEYAKRAGFSTKIRNTNRCKETKEINNQLITSNREGKWTSEVPYVEKTNPMCGANCPARIYVHVFGVFQRLFFIIHIHVVLIKLKCWHNIGSSACKFVVLLKITINLVLDQIKPINRL
ncbi:hypothetical protein PIB30_070962 [Stylosanthes scabra]|uniref:FAR1 domain-containing protein n=1 Tax=Stylosanthes scabra TaxID=79078 RepID=A0ABU6VN40_9FABA|nr:hypothetical protein [Stylosanthes scabra]